MRLRRLTLNRRSLLSGSPTMKRHSLVITVATAVLGLSADAGAMLPNQTLECTGDGTGAPPARLNYGLYAQGNQPLLQQAQFFLWGGQDFCWYDRAWYGPG